MSDPTRNHRRLGLALGLAVVLFLLHRAQLYFDRFGHLQGPAALEAVAGEAMAAVAFSGDGRTVVGIDRAGIMTRWPLPVGSPETRSLVGRGLYRKDINSITLDQRGDLCVASTGDAAYALRLNRPGNASHLNMDWGAVSRNGRFVFGTAGRGRLLFVRDARTSQPLAFQSAPQRRRFLTMDLSPDGRWMVFTTEPSGSAPWVMDLDTQAVRRLGRDAGRGMRTEVRFSPDGRYVAAAAAGEGLLTVWEADSWRQVAAFNVDERGARGFSFSPDGSLIAFPVKREREFQVGSLIVERRREPVDVLQVVEVSTGRARFDWSRPGEVRGHELEVVASAWSSDGSSVATLGEDGRVALWDVERARLVRFLPGR